MVGSLVPGSTIILALSALVPGGELKLWAVLTAAIAGAVVGDGGAFWVGHRSQREILSAWPLTNYPGVVAQSEAFFHSRGWLAVFLARFVPPIRAADHGGRAACRRYGSTASTSRRSWSGRRRVGRGGVRTA